MCAVDGGAPAECVDLWLDDDASFAFPYARARAEAEDMWCDAANPSPRCLDQSRLWELPAAAPAPERRRPRMREGLRKAPAAPAAPPRGPPSRDYRVVRVAEL